MLDLGSRRVIRLKGDVDARVRREAFRLAMMYSLEVTHGPAAFDAVLLTIAHRRTGAAQSYRLHCNGEGVTLEGQGAGLYYGLVTFRQILGQCRQWLPHFYIEDRPDFGERGVMLDISRCKVPTMDTLKQLIDRLAALKFNQLQLYTEHTFAFTRHRRVWADASPLTAPDIDELREWCEERYIDLVPNLNSFGHFERWLRHPEYHRYAECPEGFVHPLSKQPVPWGSTLKPNRNSLNLLKALYEEYLPLFSSSYFNIGGDEPWELGLGWSKERCDEQGATAVYVDFLRQIQSLVESRDRTMMFWSDIVLKDPGCLQQLSSNAMAMNWGYEASHPFSKECGQMADAGIPYYVCPGTSSWNSLTGRILNATKNLERAARAGLLNDATGYLVTDWGDHGHHQYLPVSYPGFLLGACHSWNHRGSRRLDTADGINRMFFDDHASHAGEFLVRLGHAPELTPSSLRNATLFNRLLFWSMDHEPASVRDLDPRAITEADGELGDLEHSLGRLSIPADYGPVAEELGNAVRLARHGLHRLQYYRGERQDVAHLREQLLWGIGEHERLWLERNRPGGLAESSGYLRTSLAALE